MQLLQQLSDKVKRTEPAQSQPRVAGTKTMKSTANTAPLYQRLQETEAQLDAQEAQLRELAVRAKERLASENETAKAYQRKCKFIAKGMTRDEVIEILGESHQNGPYQKNGFSTIYNFMDSKGQSQVYTEAVSFLVQRGELDAALDAYHRGLSRSSFSEYLKVYCSL